MKLKDILNESQHLSYKRMNVGEEEEKGMTNEEKREFLKAVSEYKKFGESIYRSGNLAEVYESIKNIVETAHKVTLEETGDWFDKVTVNRHMKSMNESFKVFSNTIKEVNTLQQRLESCYDEMGEVLGKYYEIKEGNEFGAERAKAIAKGEDEFEVGGKKFPVKDVDKEDKENAKKFANESMNLTDIKNSLNEGRVSAKKLLQSVVKGETDRVEGIKMSKEMAQAFLDWQRLSPFGKKYGNLPFNRLFTAAFSFGLNRHADKKSKEYKELEAKAKQMFKARRGESVNEGKHDAILDKLADIVKGAKSFMDIGKELKSNGIKYSFGTNMIPMYIIDKPAKIAILNNKYADGAERVVGDTAIGLMESLTESINGESSMKLKDLLNKNLTEGASTEEKRIVMMAVRKIAKYRNVDIKTAVMDVWRAAEELERDIKKGKVKK